MVVGGIVVSMAATQGWWLQYRKSKSIKLVVWGSDTGTCGSMEGKMEVVMT